MGGGGGILVISACVRITSAQCSERDAQLAREVSWEGRPASGNGADDPYIG